MVRGFYNAQISKSLGIHESTIRYYRKRPAIKKIKSSSNLQQKYIDKIYELPSNKATREMSGGLIAIIINKKLKKSNALDKNGKLITITKSQVNCILTKKFGKHLKIWKVFYLNEESKKRVEFCEKIVQSGLEGKNSFSWMKPELTLHRLQKGEYICASNKILNKIKRVEEEGYERINRETKKYKVSIIVDWGVSFYGLYDFILLNGTMKDFLIPKSFNFIKKIMKI